MHTSRPSNILITGPPGIGKTTLIRKLADDLRSMGPTGFTTREIREHGIRKGFDLVGLDGRRALLSHVSIPGRFRVGKYTVDVAGFEAFLRPLLETVPGSRIIIVDEIGKMECFSSLFRDWIRGVLDAPPPVIASIALKGGGLIQEIKERADVRLFTVSLQNRDSLLPTIRSSLTLRSGL
jgi:nucleoside-triphosphatase